ncbi:hypothetical protein FBU59_004267, partial [Linderina macrospora]
MDINDIFKEKVTSTSINSGKRRRLGPVPTLEKLKEEGYGIAAPKDDLADDSDDSSEDAAKKRARLDPAEDALEAASDSEGGRFFSDGLSTKEKG